MGADGVMANIKSLRNFLARKAIFDELKNLILSWSESLQLQMVGHVCLYFQAYFQAIAKRIALKNAVSSM
jgi:hypothetical protein